MPEWLPLCLSRSVIKRALLSALIVGVILITINHGDAILHGQIDQERSLQILLTLCVPYLVSTFPVSVRSDTCTGNQVSHHSERSIHG